MTRTCTRSYPLLDRRDEKEKRKVLKIAALTNRRAQRDRRMGAMQRTFSLLPSSLSFESDSERGLRIFFSFFSLPSFFFSFFSAAVLRGLRGNSVVAGGSCPRGGDVARSAIGEMRR